MAVAGRALVAGITMAMTAAAASAQTQSPSTLTLMPPATIWAGVPTVVPFVVLGPPGVVPTGSVTITSTDYSGSCTVAVSAGACELLFWAPGDETLAATYSGDADLLPSSDVRVVQILGGAYATETTIGEISPWPVMAGEPVQVHATVLACMPPFGQCPSLGGPITISDVLDPSVRCTIDSYDVSRACSLTLQAAGERTLKAEYAGAGAFRASEAYRTLTVGPRVASTADGVSGTFFDTYLLLANPGEQAEPLSMVFTTAGGGRAAVAPVIPAGARVTWKADDIAALGAGAFATTVTVPSGRPVIVERATYFAEDYRAGHASLGRAPSTRAFFAEGCQNTVFDTYLLIGHAGNDIAHVLVRFLPDHGDAVNRTYAIAPGIRFSITAAGIPELAGRSFGIDVISSAPVAVERSMYFGQGYRGGHSDVGVPRLSTAWLFAEGATGPTFQTFLLLANPVQDGPTSATIRYRTGSNRTVVRTHLVPANGRLSIAVANEDPELASTTFWAEIRSTHPIVAERAMYWSQIPGEPWTEGHVSAGTTAPAARWGFAEGIVGGGLGFTTFLLVANPGATTATIDVRYLATRGGPAISRVYTVPPVGRLTIDVGAEAPELRDVPFGAVVSARDGAAIVVERSVYWTRNGPTFVGGTNALGLPF